MKTLSNLSATLWWRAFWGSSGLRLIIFTAALAFAYSAQSACAPRVQWQITFGEPYLAEALLDVKPETNGSFSVFVNAETMLSPNEVGNSYFTLWFDAEGNLLSKGDVLLPPPPYWIFQALKNGDFMVTAGWSISQFGGVDYHVARVDRNWQPRWVQTLGGTNDDKIAGVRPTTDSGFLLGGESFSPPSGNKTSPQYGLGDFWMVRLDVSGQELWQESYGGTQKDRLTSFQQTTDGGFILGGWSTSPLSGNKTSPFFGNTTIGDYWIVRIGPDGTKLWDRSFGGTEHDWLSSVQQTRDGGFILGGWSASPVSGNKTAPLLGGNDSWLVRLDEIGNRIWDKSFGGTNSNEGLGLIVELPDGGFLATGNGYISSGFGSLTPLGGVLWRVDAAGNTLWSQALRRGEDVNITSIEPTADGGFLIGGSTFPNGRADVWVVKLTGEVCDSDDDGVPDELDHCLNTPAGSVVDGNGCSLQQLCPCATASNHGQYLQCVRVESERFLAAGLISDNEREELLKAAKNSDCGK